MNQAKMVPTALLMVVAVVLSGTSPLMSSNGVKLEFGFGSYTTTDDPFDRFPLLKAGFHFKLSSSFTLGVSMGFTRWSDYLGMYGGAYTFCCYRPEIELTYSFPPFLKGGIEPFSGIGFGHHFYRIKNELDNPYPGELNNHFFMAPFLGVNFGLGQGASGLAKNIFLTARMVWNISEDFSGLRGSLGLGIRFD